MQYTFLYSIEDLEVYEGSLPSIKGFPDKGYEENKSFGINGAINIDRFIKF